ncbi:MAG TPA: thermonuclease family protein [Methylomirabilota bacterium]|jgi:micrococcal nuclease|nr:thermonuclease family protein [Methylomirabilota bacterium]
MALVLLLATLVAAPGALEGVVVYVADGDTIHVRLGEHVEKVRYIGINAPEVPHPGHERTVPSRRWTSFPHTAAAGEAARRINLELVTGRQVRLELARQQRDNYGRLLAYVWVGDVMINAEMVRRGYAEVMSIPPDFTHRVLFLRLQDEARQARRGLWGSP